MSTHTEQIMYVQTPEFARHAERIVEVTDATSRLNVLPFSDSKGRAELLSVVFGGPLPESVTIYPPFFTEYGLNTTFGENVFVNQGCTFMDKGGIRIGDGVMIAPKVSLISGAPSAARRASRVSLLRPDRHRGRRLDRDVRGDLAGSDHRCRSGGRCRCGGQS